MPTDDPEAGPAVQGAPAIPSFDSLRGPRRRSPVDVLVRADRPAAAQPRPPEWPDLLLLGRHVAGVVVGAQARLLRWSVRAPVSLVRRALGG